MMAHLFKLCFSFLALALFYNFYWKRRRLPPGPAPWPLVGNLLELARADHWPAVFARWARPVHGNLFTFWLGEHPILNITCRRLAQQLFVKQSDAFLERALFPHVDGPSRGGHLGLAFLPGRQWRACRDFVMRTYRTLGVGTAAMQGTASGRKCC